jgi:hypothetical protein
MKLQHVQSTEEIWHQWKAVIRLSASLRTPPVDAAFTPQFGRKAASQKNAYRRLHFTLQRLNSSRQREKLHLLAG